MSNTNNPIQQTSPIQSIPEPENLPVNVPNIGKRFKPPLIIGISIMMFVITGGAYYLGTKQNKSIIQDIQPQPTQQVESELSPTKPVVSPSQTVDSIPQENSIYFGTYQGKDALFITDKEKQVFYEGGTPRTSPYIGELATAEGGWNEPFDYKNLINPIKILSSSAKPISSINSLITNNSKSFIYASVNYKKEGSQYPDMLNSILQIKTDGSSVKEIWSNDLDSSSKYPKAGGATYLEKVANDKYVTFWIADCYACSGSPVGTIVLNITSKGEKYYEMIGDVQLNLEANTWSYRKLSPFQEACEPSPSCDNGQRTVMKPAGQVYTENLP